MKKLILALCYVCLALSVATAASVHWVGSQIDATIDTTTGDLVVDFKIAGLGSTPVTTDVTVSAAEAAATWACRNHGGQWPADPKKTTVAGPVTATGTFTSGKNGAIEAQLALSAPSVADPDGFCPGGQELVLVAISYTGVQLSNALAGLYALGDFALVLYSL